MATSCDGCGQLWQRHGLVEGSWCSPEEDARAKDEPVIPVPALPKVGG